MSDGVKRVLAAVVAMGELLLLPLALFWAAMSVMMFDAPGSSEKTVLWLAFWCAWLMPVALLVGAGFAIAATVRFTKRRMMTALLLPLSVLFVSIGAISAI